MKRLREITRLSTTAVTTGLQDQLEELRTDTLLCVPRAGGGSVILSVAAMSTEDAGRLLKPQTCREANFLLHDEALRRKLSGRKSWDAIAFDLYDEGQIASRNGARHSVATQFAKDLRARFGAMDL